MSGRSRQLTKEELELWAHVTRNDEPLGKPRPAPPTPEPQLPAPPKAEALASTGKVEPTKTVNGHKSAPRKLGPPPPQPFDRRAERALARGAKAIDARLDLHGMRQGDAHRALIGFLAHCQDAGHKHVLIITGKGATGSDDEGVFWNESRRGVLRRLVPEWLRDPQLRVFVVSHTEASPKHGGGGALYVTIRRRRSLRA